MAFIIRAASTHKAGFFHFSATTARSTRAVGTWSAPTRLRRSICAMAARGSGEPEVPRCRAPRPQLSLRDAHRNPATGGCAWTTLGGSVTTAANHCYGVAFVVLAYARRFWQGGGVCVGGGGGKKKKKKGRRRRRARVAAGTWQNCSRRATGTPRSASSATKPTATGGSPGYRGQKCQYASCCEAMLAAFEATGDAALARSAPVTLADRHSMRRPTNPAGGRRARLALRRAHLNASAQLFASTDPAVLLFRRHGFPARPSQIRPGPCCCWKSSSGMSEQRRLPGVVPKGAPASLTAKPDAARMEDATRGGLYYG